MLRSNVMQQSVGRAFSSTYDRLERAAIAAARRNDAMLLYVPDSRRGVFQDSTGLVAANVGDPIGLLLDRQYDAQADYITGAWTASGTTVRTIAKEVTFDAAPSNSFADLNADLSVGKSYLVEYTVSARTAGDVRVIIYANGYYAVSQTRSAVGAYREVLAVNTAGGVKTDTIRVATGVASATATVTGLSVKEVIGYRAIQPTAASKPTLVRIPRKRGPELVINGGFDSPANWSVISTTISGGSLALAVQFAYAQQTIEFKPGASYVVSYTVTASSGPAPLALSGSGLTGVTTTIPAVVGRNSVVVTCVNTTNLLKLIAPNTGTSVTIDDVSVREVLEWSNVLSFDGVDDFLDVTFRDYYAAGASTCVASWFGAVLANTGFIIAETSLVSNTPLLSPVGIASGTSNAGFFMRDDVGAQPHNFTNYSPGGFADTNVVGVVDSGSNLKGYTRGIKTYDVNYSRGGAITASKITVGATQRTGNSNWVKIPIALICWSANVMSDADRKAIERFGSYLVGEPYA